MYNILPYTNESQDPSSQSVELCEFIMLIPQSNLLGGSQNARTTYQELLLKLIDIAAFSTYRSRPFAAEQVRYLVHPEGGKEIRFCHEPIA